MYFILILAAALVIPIPAKGASRGMEIQSAQTENQEKPATDAPASMNSTSSEGKPEESSSEKKAEAGSQPPQVNKPASGRGKRRSRTKRPAAASSSEPRKTVIRHGSASEPLVQILPGLSQEEAERQRASAEQLLGASDSSLKELAARPLNTHQQETVVQIRQYMDVARSAIKDSDIQRAHTLALKAYLLAEDLVKHEK